jgi:hypothetical protein
MKTLLSTIFVFLVAVSGHSQGQVVSITVDPAAPTTNDDVTVYVDLMFTSGGCELDNKSHSTNGNSTIASSHHCVGMLTVICNITDTFDLGNLQAGNHQFDFTLTSGSGGPSCTPGIVADDNSVLNFTVTQALDVENSFPITKVNFYPNPMSELASIHLDPSFFHDDLTLEILDGSGRVVYSRATITSDILLYDLNLTGGIYFYRILDDHKIIAADKFVVE